MGKKRAKQDDPSGSLDDSTESTSLQKSLVEQLLEALKHKDVIEVLGKAMAPFAMAMVQESVTNVLDSINSKLAQLAEENKKLSNNMNVIIEENKALKSRLTTVEERLEDMEKEKRLKSLIIRGIPETSTPRLQWLLVVARLSVSLDTYQWSKA